MHFQYGGTGGVQGNAEGEGGGGEGREKRKRIWSRRCRLPYPDLTTDLASARHFSTSTRWQVLTCECVLAENRGHVKRGRWRRSEAARDAFSCAREWSLPRRHGCREHVVSRARTRTETVTSSVRRRHRRSRRCRCPVRANPTTENAGVKCRAERCERK